MKTITGIIYLLPAVLMAADIDLGQREVTFTNLQGKVYEGVILKRAIRDGVLYSTENGGGMVYYTNLSLVQISAWGLSTNLPQEFLDRKESERQAKIQAEMDRKNQIEIIRQDRERDRQAAAERLRTNPPPERPAVRPRVTPRNQIGLGT
jgi:hypothetical protein